MNVRRWTVLMVAAALATGAGCASNGGDSMANTSGSAAAAAEPSTRFNKPGFVTFAENGRLWVFRRGSDALADYLEHGEPARSITLVGRGPHGMSIRAVDRATAEAYLAAP